MHETVRSLSEPSEDYGARFTVNNKPNAKHPWFRRASRLLNLVQNFTKFMAIFYSVIFFFFSFETPHLSFVKPAKGLQELKLE